MKHYFSDGTWFDKGTEAHFICISLEVDSKVEAGIFRGLHNGNWDEEACLMEEFDIQDDGYKD